MTVEADITLEQAAELKQHAEVIHLTFGRARIAINDLRCPGTYRHEFW